MKTGNFQLTFRGRSEGVERGSREIEEHKQKILFRKTFTSLAKRNLESITFQDTGLIPYCRGLLNPADKGSPVSGAVSSHMPRDENKPLCLCCARLKGTRLWNGKISEIKYQLRR